MNLVELVVAGLFAAGGIRSMWTWARRPFEGTDVADHLLYAGYLTGRIGVWFSLAGVFATYAFTANGHATGEELSGYRWFFVVPIGLAALQLLAGLALGRRGSA
jgi:hypothetical protein